MKFLKTLIFVLTFAYSFSGIGQTVYKTKTGEKFHKSSCNYLKYSKIALSLEDALSYGYDACKVCKPTNKASSSSLSAKSNSGNNKPKKTNAERNINTHPTRKGGWRKNTKLHAHSAS